MRSGLVGGVASLVVVAASFEHRRRRQPIRPIATWLDLACERLVSDARHSQLVSFLDETLKKRRHVSDLVADIPQIICSDSSSEDAVLHCALTSILKDRDGA